VSVNVSPLFVPIRGGGLATNETMATMRIEKDKADLLAVGGARRMALDRVQQLGSQLGSKLGKAAALTKFDSDVVVVAAGAFCASVPIVSLSIF
jgi:hypothetical protein